MKVSSVFKEKTRELDPNSELCYFVGYPKGTKCWLFYDLKKQIVLVTTNVIFLKDDYIIDQKPNDRFHIRELFDTSREPLKESSNPMEDVLESNTSSLLYTQVTS